MFSVSSFRVLNYFILFSRLMCVFVGSWKISVKLIKFSEIMSLCYETENLKQLVLIIFM